MTIKTVGSDVGDDYLTWNAFWSNCPPNLVTTTQTWEGEAARNEELSHSSTISCSGITTDATYYVQMRPASGAGFADTRTPGTDPIRYDGTDGAAIKFTGAWVIGFSWSTYNATRFSITGLQFQHTNSNSAMIYNDTYSQPMTIDSCIFEGVTATYAVHCHKNTGTDGSIRNCAFISANATAKMLRGGGGTNVEFCTFYAAASSVTASAVSDYYGALDFDNCLFLGYNDFQSGTAVHTVDYCINDTGSWESSTVGTGNSTAGVASTELVNASTSPTTCDLTLKSGADAEGAGNPISGITTDIFGQTRDGTNPCIGCYEIPAGGGGATLVPAGMQNLGSQFSSNRAARIGGVLQ